MKDIPLGKQQDYSQEYSPDILFPIARNKSRAQLTYSPFKGFDVWNAYEFSYLNHQGVPQALVLRMWVPVDSENIVESKSLKLYLNTFAFKIFQTQSELLYCLSKDIEQCIKGKVKLELLELDSEKLHVKNEFPDATLLDTIELTSAPDFNELKSSLLAKGEGDSEGVVSLYTHLFRSICPVTAQPDWASVFIKYQGKKISEESLLSYLLSFRKHAGFHEDCVEKIYSDILEYCQPEKLSVSAAFTRRGGIDINPFRSNFEKDFLPLRLSRQ